jgi:hypothetical protein
LPAYGRPNAVPFVTSPVGDPLFAGLDRELVERDRGVVDEQRLALGRVLLLRGEAEEHEGCVRVGRRPDRLEARRVEWA